MRNGRKFYVNGQATPSTFTPTAEFTAWYNKGTALGYSDLSEAEQVYINDNLFKLLVNEGVWTYMDAAWIGGISNENRAKINIVDPDNFTLQYSGTVTWTNYQGWVTDAVSSYIDTGFTGADGVNYLNDSAGLAYYLYSAPTSGNAMIGDSANGNYIRMRYDNDAQRFQTTGDSTPLTPFGQVGELNQVFKTSATQTLVYQGSSIATQSGTDKAISAAASIYINHYDTAYSDTGCGYFAITGDLASNSVAIKHNSIITGFFLGL